MAKVKVYNLEGKEIEDIELSDSIFGLEENDVIHVGKGLVQRTLYLVSFVWITFSQRIGLLLS